MKRLLLSFVLVLISMMSTAGATEINAGVYPDPGGASCNIVDDQAGLLNVYVVVIAPDGATALQMAAPMPTCMVGATWLTDTDPFGMIIGSSQTGFAYGFGSCLTGPIHVITISYFVQGTSEPCCMYPVYPDPSVPSGKIEVTDCNYQVVYAWGKVSSVNGDSSCPCGYPVPVERATWGAIKSLYTDR